MGKYDFIDPIFNKYSDIANEFQGEASRVNDTKAKQVTGTLISGTVQAIPSAILAFMSVDFAAGQATTAAGLVTAGQTSTLGTVLGGAVKDLGSNSMFWNSFLQIAGPTYEKEIADGASEIKASASALLNGVLGSAIEISGGIEKFSINDKG